PLHEGDVLRAGLLLDAPRLLEVPDAQSADHWQADDAEVDVLHARRAAGEVVLRLEFDPLVEQALEIEVGTAKLGAAGERAERHLQRRVGRDRRPVALDAAA